MDRSRWCLSPLLLLESALLLASCLAADFQDTAVLFSSKLCGPCERVAEALSGLERLQTTTERPLAIRFGIVNFPTLLYVHGRAIEPDTFQGNLLETSKVEEWIKSFTEAIRDIPAEALEEAIRDTDFLIVLFAEPGPTALRKVARKASRMGVKFARVSEPRMWTELGLTTIPAAILYQHSVPTMFTGDLKDEEAFFKWIKESLDDIIEDVDSKTLMDMIESSETLAVLFYDSKSKTVLQDLEKIDDETDQHGIPFVKISDYNLASELGVADELPALIYYENGTANIFQGDLRDEDSVLKWLIHQKEHDEIESVTDEILDQLIQSSEYLSVLFYAEGSEGGDQSVLEDLEHIDDDTDRLGIPFVKTDDSRKASELGLETLPALVYFENATPNVYQGDLKEEEQVLEWLGDQQKTSSIEEVTEKFLTHLVQKEDAVVALFYYKNDQNIEAILKELENIDDDLDLKEVEFVKVANGGASFGITHLPAVAFFKRGQPLLYEGDLKEEEDLLEWVESQMEASRIQEVTAAVLDRTIKQNEHVAVLFYQKHSKAGDEAVRELEKIDDETGEHQIIFVKTEDRKAIKKYKIEELPKLIFFEHSIPNVYSGDLTQEEQVLDWILTQKSTEEIEDLPSSMLSELLDSYDSLVVLFYDKTSPRSQEVLSDLETIDGPAEKMGIPFFKLDDLTMAREYGVRDQLPALLYFEERIPNIYEGDLSKEEEVLEWLVRQHSEDSIEEVTEEILENLIIDREYVLVLFSPDDCGVLCDEILVELENIDDDLDQYGTLFVSTSDIRLLRRQVSPNVPLPALVMFRHGEPILYTGDLKNEDRILAWATSDEVLDQPGKIDEVQKKLLEKMLNLTDYLVVYFYQGRCSECERALRSLERVDDQLDNTDLNMVKVSDPKVTTFYNIRTFPALTFFKNKMPIFYDGDIHNPDEVLDWIIDVKTRPYEQIVDIKEADVLEEMLEERRFFVVYFYQTKDDVLRGLEAIYDDLRDKYELEIVKTNVLSIAEEMGITEFPCLVYFENKMPSIYTGDLLDESAIMEWLVHQTTEDTIENINRGMLFRMIEEQQYLTVFFYVANDPESQEILKHLEMIDDDCSDYEIQFVRMSDPLMAKKYGVRNPPGLVFFRNGKAVKYPGDLLDEEEVLDWLTSPENMELSDAIEKVNRRMFERVLARTEFLAVLYYSKERCKKCERTLEELEKIDDDADREGIKFVKIDDPKMARRFGVFAIPAIVFYKNGDEEDYVIYAGNLLDGNELLEWLLKMKDPSGDVIEEVDHADLAELVETSDYIAVFFYPEEESECEDCKEILADLENIDDDTDRHGIRFVKCSDPLGAARFGVEERPALVYFEHMLPSVFEGDLSAEEEVLQWLIQQKTEDTIETVNRDMLDKLIHDEQYLAVYFYKPHCKACDQVLQELEDIDDDLDEFGIHIVKTSDSGVAKRYGLKSFPAMVYFRNGNPLVYDGNLKDENAVLEWLTDEDTRELEDEIEAINHRMLNQLISSSEYLAVIFYDAENDDFADMIQELEEIDDDAELFGIDFVKVNDLEAAVAWNVRTFPTLAYFRKGIPTFYEGDLMDSEKVLRWLTSHDMIEIKDEIENVNRKMLEKLLEENDFVAVLFYDETEEEQHNNSVLNSLENIDDEASELDLLFVKVNDPKFAKRYGLTNLPTLVYFRRRFPNVFRGDLNDEEEVLEWLKKSRYRHPELNWFMYGVVSSSIMFILYTAFLKFCLRPPTLPPPPSK